MTTATAEPVYERTGFRLSWGAIFAGFFVATGAYLILSLLGVAVGLSAWSPMQNGAQAFGTGVGIWMIVAGLGALFLGGMTTGRLAGVLRKGDGALHGIVLWALTTVAILWMAVMGAGFLLGGVFNIAGQAAGGAIQAAGVIAPEIAGPAARGAIRGEEREVLVQQIMTRANVSRGEAESIVSDVETRAQEAQTQVQQQIDTLQARAPQIAEDATDVAANAAWWTLLAMGLSLGAAALGATMTARK